MKHLLMDPAYPDIVGEWARGGLNDNEEGAAKDRIDDRATVCTVSRDPEGCLYAELNPQDLTWLGNAQGLHDLTEVLVEIEGRIETARTRVW